jgi:Flp pilus assembly protein TadG
VHREAAPVAGRRRRSSAQGQAIVEFALASLLFFLIVFGTVDFGRAIYVWTTLHNAVREGARVGKVDPSNQTAIRAAVVDYAPGLGLTTGAVTIACSGSCATGDAVTVSTSLAFSAVTQDLLHISPITLSASATDEIE